MKIVVSTHLFWPSVGGVEINSEILAGEFADAGARVTVVTTSSAERQRDFGFVVMRNPSWAGLCRALWESDVILVNNPCMRLAWPLLVIPKPHVIAVRTWIQRPDGTIAWPDRLKFWWLKQADGLIANSRAVARFHRHPAKVIGNPYRRGLFDRAPGDAAPADAFVFMGRLVSDKGADIAIRALQRLRRQHGRGRLAIIGDGPEREALEQQARELGVRNAVEFTGKLEGNALVETLQRHRYLLVPSRWAEPFGNVALEGMACGCVPIVSSGGGLPDAVGDAGLVFESGNVDALADAMARVLADPSLEANLRAKADEHLANHLPDRVARQYLEVLETVAGVGRPVV